MSSELNNTNITTGASRVSRLWGDGFGGFATRCAQVLIVIALTSLVVIAGVTLKTPVIAVLLALILSCAFSPLVRVFVRLHFPRALAAAVTMILVIGVLGGLLTLVGFAVAKQASTLGHAVGKGFTQVETFLKDQGFPVDGTQAQKVIKAVESYFTSAKFGTSALLGLSVAGEILTGAVILLFVLFFFLRDGNRIWEFLIRPFKDEQHARAERIGHSGALVLGSYARGTATIAAIDAVIIGLALFFLHVPLALPLAVLVFITAFIPIIGAPIAGVLAAAVALVSNGPLTAVIIVGVIILVHVLEGNLLHPVIMGHAVSLHPLAILLALTAGTILGGVVGAILAVPTASVIWAAVKAWEGEHAETIVEADEKKPPVQAARKRFGRKTPMNKTK